MDSTHDLDSAETTRLRARLAELEQAEARRAQAETALRAQARQQAAVAELGQRALAGLPLPQLMDDAVRLVAQTLEIEFASVLELLPGAQRLLLRAGVGWPDGLVGEATIDAGRGSHAGYTLLANGPVVVDDLAHETRFEGTASLRKHGIVSSIETVILGHQRPFGVLGAHTTTQRRFRNDHVQFLRATANVLATAIERARADDELAESEFRFRALVELAPDMIVSIATDGGAITALNPAFETITGLPRGEWLGREFLPLIHPDDVPLAKQAFERLLRGEPSTLYELRIRTRSGEHVSLETRATLRFEDDHAVEVFAIMRDVSDRKRAEAELRRSRDELAVILQGVGDGILAQEPNGRISYANEAAVKLTGYASPEELLTASIDEVQRKFELRREDGTPLPIEELPGRRALMGQGGSEATLRVYYPTTGEERWAVDRAAPVRDADGNVRLTVSIFRDITASKQAEERDRFLEQASAMLAGSLDFETTLATVTRLIVPRLADWCFINTLSDNGMLQRAAVAHADPEREGLLRIVQEKYPPRPNSTRGVANVMRTGQSMLLSEVTDARLSAIAQSDEHLEILRALQLRSVIVTPLVARGRTLGAISFGAGIGRQPYGPSDLALAEELARRAALALDNALLYREATRAAERLKAVAQATEVFAAAQLDLDVVLRAAAEQITESIADACAVRLVSDDGQWLVPIASFDRDSTVGASLMDMLQRHPQPSDHGVQGRVVQTGEPAFFPRLDLEELGPALDPEQRDWLSRFGVHSFLLAPLRARGRVIGMIGVARHRTRQSFTVDDMTLIQEIADRAALAIENARLYRSAQLAIQQQDESLALLDTLLETAPVGFSFRDTDLRYLRINDMMASFNALPREAHIGRTMAELAPQLAQVVEPHLRRVLETGAPIIDIEVSGEARSTPGATRHWLASYYPVRTPDGAINGLGAVVVEITERKRLEAQRAQLLESEREARAEAQRAARSREEFLSIASHELKTPLTSVKAATQLLDRWLRQETLDAGRVERTMNQLRGEIERLEGLVADLLDASRIQQGRLELRPTPTDLVELAGGILERFEHSPERTARHRLVLDASAPVTGLWDPDRIDQVVTNLVSNALKYSPEGGDVCVRLSCDSETASLTVEDHGIGIPPDEQRQLFQPFTRGAFARQSAGGAGLGLYISAQIVAQHGGVIAVESAPGVGSSFTVRLPYGPGAGDAGDQDARRV